MTEPLSDTWHQRDLPVLRTVVRMYDDELRPIQAGEVMAETGLSDEDITRAGMALREARLVDVLIAHGPAVLHFSGVSAEARRLSGAWPTPERGVDRLIAALENLAENGTDDERTRAQRILEALSGAGQQIAVGVATAVITGQIT